MKTTAINRHLFILGLSIPVAAASNAQQAGRPNFIVILADDMGYGDLGCYGNTDIKTPVLDKMAAGGLLLTDCHSNGSLSTPTRAALLTGRYQQRAGLEGVILEDIPAHRTTGLQPGETTFARLLRDNGYATALMGKWHLGREERYNPLNFGFDEFFGFKTGNIDYHTHLDVMCELDWWEGRELKDHPGYTTEIITDRSVKFIENNRNRPFCLYIAHACPHDPIQGPNDPPGRFTDAPSKPPYPEHRPARDAYRDMMENMDKCIGEVLEAVRKAGVQNNTLVVFMSDNGPNLRYGSAGVLRGEKSSMFEGGHRVCGIMYMPSVIEPGVSEQTVMSMDLFPTMMDMAGISADKTLDGISLVKLFRGGKLPSRTLYWALGPRKAVRDGKWKLVLIRNGDDGSGEPVYDKYLFDLSEDISEENNLAERKRSRVKRLMRKLDAWEKEVRGGVPEQLVQHIQHL